MNAAVQRKLPRVTAYLACLCAHGIWPPPIWIPIQKF